MTIVAAAPIRVRMSRIFEAALVYANISPPEITSTDPIKVSCQSIAIASPRILLASRASLTDSEHGKCQMPPYATLGLAVKTIGLLGGMSWESSIVYEQIINQEVRARLGGVHSASLLIRSYDFAQIERLQAAGDWEQAGQLLAADAARLQDAGAQILALATNTMHQVYAQIAAAVSIPFPHIADATGAAVSAAGLSRVGLLGTRFTMERGFYRDRLEAIHDLKVLVQAEPDRALVHRVIYDELVQGVISDASRRHYLEIIGRLTEAGAEGVIAAAPRSSCSSPPMTPRCPTSPPPSCTRRPRWTWRSPATQIYRSGAASATRPASRLPPRSVDPARSMFGCRRRPWPPTGCRQHRPRPPR